MRMARRAPFEARSTVPPRQKASDSEDEDDGHFPNYDDEDPEDAYYRPRQEYD